MKRMSGWIGIAAVAALGMPARAGTPDAKADVIAAAKKLAEAASYGWTTTAKSEGGGGGGGGQNRFQPGPTEGKTEKDGFTSLSMSFGETKTEAILKGDKLAIKGAEGWKAGSELGGQGGGQQGRRDPSAMVARGLRTFKTPAAQLESLAEKTRELKSEEGGLYSSELTEEGAKELLAAGGRGGNNPPQVAEPKGSLKVWVKDGVVSKYEVAVSGKVTFGQREIAINRTTTTEIKDVGAAKVEVPEEAKAKLQ
jgi:hypothetical protein